MACEKKVNLTSSTVSCNSFIPNDTVFCEEPEYGMNRNVHRIVRVVHHL